MSIIFFGSCGKIEQPENLGREKKPKSNSRVILRRKKRGNTSLKNSTANEKQ